MAGARILHWNGIDVPAELRDLPSGQYVVEPVEVEPLLTREEEEGLRKALSSMHAGRGRTMEQVRKTIDALLRR